MAAGLLALPFGTAHAAETPVYDTSQAALAQSQLRDVTGRVTAVSYTHLTLPTT